MPHPPAPVTDLAWSPDAAHDLATPRASTSGPSCSSACPRCPSPATSRPLTSRPPSRSRCPRSRCAVDDLVAHLRELTFEQSLHLGHPAFLAYICGAGTVPGAAAELLAAGLNPCVGGYRLGPGAAEIELHLTRWLAARFGLPEGAGGMIMTGGAMANFVALKCARDDRLGIDVREHGVRDHAPAGIYASEEAHVVIRRAADMLGLGAGAVRAIAIDGEQRMRPDALAAAIERDARRRRPPARGRARPPAPRRPARSTRSTTIADVAADHGLWLHVDAAYGGAAVLSDELRPLLAGVEHADSLAIDPHKWLYTAQSAGCVLLREFGHLSRSFHADASYIWLDEAARHGVDFAMHGPQFSRGFAALKVWVSLLAHGRAAYGRRIAHDAALARYLGDLVVEHPDFELMCEPRLSICCFRYRPRGWGGSEEALDRLNERLMTAIHSDGRVYCSNAVIDGRFGLRACIVNFRTEAPDVERLLAVAAELGELEQQRRVV